MTARAKKVNREINVVNFPRLMGLAGYVRVEDLARKIGRSRVTIHRAVKHPNTFGPTYRKIAEVLLG